MAEQASAKARFLYQFTVLLLLAIGPSVHASQCRDVFAGPEAISSEALVIVSFAEARQAARAFFDGRHHHFVGYWNLLHGFDSSGRRVLVVGVLNGFAVPRPIKSIHGVSVIYKPIDLRSEPVIYY